MRALTWSSSFALLVVSVLTACGGGGDSSAPATPLRADLSVTVANPSGTVAAGGSAQFGVLVVNNGPDAATNVTISLSPASSLALGSVTCTAAGGAACPSAPGASMSVASLPVGGSLSFAVPATIAVGTSGSVAFGAAVTAANDPQSANNSATVNLVVYSADVGVTANGPAAAVAGGATADFSVVVTNAGPDAARDVNVSTALGTGLTVGSVSCVAGNGATCPSVLGGSFSIPSLPAGGVLTLSMPATVVAGTNGTVSLGAAASAAGDPLLANNSATAQATAYSANVGVSNTTSANVGSGGTAFFTVTVANSGPGTAQNMTINTTVSAGYSLGTISCAAAGGATCPASLGGSFVVPSLPIGGSLTLTVPVAVPATATGSLSATVAVASAGDPVGGNNSVSATTNVVAADARNGRYYAYTTTGQLYALTLDFNALTYVMTGNGLNTVGAFTANTGGNYTIAGNARFRVEPDLVVGGFDFGSGVRPFVAARRFVADLTQLDGQEFNIFGVNTPVSSGSADSRVFSARWSGGNTLTICVDNVIYAFSQCPAASRWTYAVTASGADSEFTGVDVAHNDTIVFRVAQSGADAIYIRVGTTTDNATRQFRIGVPNTAGLTPMTTQGGATDGSWNSILLSNTSYVFNGISAQGNIILDTSTLGDVGIGPTGIRRGTFTQSGAGFFVMQSSTLSIAVGARSGPLTGFMQIGAQ